MSTTPQSPTRLAAPPPLVAPWSLKLGASLLAALGAAAFAWALAHNEPALAWSAYLIGAFLALGLGVFGVLWISILYLAKGAWSVSMRRIPEAMTAWLVPGGALALAVLLGAPYLYEWADGTAVARDPALAHKAAFLNPTLFAIVLGASVCAWAFLGSRLVRNSRRQDLSGDLAASRANVRWSAVFVVVYALTFSATSFYLLMSLEARWFSTIYGVLAFTDMMQAGLAFVSLVAAVFIWRGRLAGFLNENHLHSVAKMLFAVTGFWAYIYFCQFLLIWYGNLPEEVVYFTRRSANGWLPYLLVLPLAKFALPFLLLMRRQAKRSARRVAGVAVWVLFAQIFELFILVAPSVGGADGTVVTEGHLPIIEALVALGFLGAFTLVFIGALGRHNPVPHRDPRLRECLDMHS